MSSTSTILAACAALCAILPVLLQITTAEPDFYIQAQVNFDDNSKTPCIEFQGIVSLEDDAGSRLNVPGTALAAGSCSQNSTYLSLYWDELMVVLFIKARGALFYVHQVQLYAPDKTLFYHSFTQEDSPLTGANQGVLLCAGPVWIDLPKQKPVEPPFLGTTTTTSTSTSTTVPPSTATPDSTAKPTTPTESTLVTGPLTLPTSKPLGGGSTEASTSSITTETSEVTTSSITTVSGATNGPEAIPSSPTPQARMWSRTQPTYRAVILSKLALRFNTNPTTLPPLQVDSCRREPDFAVLLIAAGALAGATVVSAIVVAVKLLPCSC